MLVRSTDIDSRRLSTNLTFQAQGLGLIFSEVDSEPGRELNLDELEAMFTEVHQGMLDLNNDFYSVVAIVHHI